GVGLGLWARPAMSERQMALPPVEAPAAAAPSRGLQIILDDTPAPLGAPIEVLPGSAEPPRAAPAEPPSRELLAPVRPAVGLVRVQSVEPEAEPAEAPPPPKAVRKTAAKPAPQKVAPPKPMKIKAVAAPKAKPPKVEKPARLEKVKTVEKARAKPAVSKVVKAEPKPAKIRVAKLDRPSKPARIEKVEVKRPAKLSGIVRAVERITPRKPVATPKPQKVRLEVKKTKAPKPRVEKVVQKAQPAKAAPPVKAIKPVKGAGPLRIAKAQPRPDTAIRDADRQMDRAYSSARAAGVPDWQLRKQQARWEAARASAAREAPWAVHDVYLARIAELHDLTKDAQASGY
ncbi:MAG: hypothetical protein ACREEG_01480, partial [Phenylobacterium sp.]